MGVIDEHWCSECGHSLDKTKDRYVEVDYINDRKGKKGKGKFEDHNRAFLCKKCFESDPAIKEKFGRLRLKGNPNFIPTVECKHYDKCPTYEYRSKKVRCTHICVSGDMVYCSRRHPGGVKLNQEAMKVLEEKEKLMNEVSKTLLKNMGDFPMAEEFLRAFLDGKDMKNLWLAYSTPPVTPVVINTDIDPVVERRMGKPSPLSHDVEGHVTGERKGSQDVELH